MGDFARCGSCSCLVKSGESACPFCDAVIEASPPRATRVRRMSRAAWLSLRTSSMFAVAGTAATALVAAASNGCFAEDNEPLNETSDAAARTVTASEPYDSSHSIDAQADSDAGEAKRAAHRDRSQFFACGPSLKCASTTQYCFHWTDSNSQYACWDEPPTKPRITETYQCRSLGTLTDAEQASLDAVCPEGPTCACEWDAGYALFKGPKLQPNDPHEWPDTNFECAEGGIAWIARRITSESGCGGCYGSPPARLDRLVG